MFIIKALKKIAKLLLNSTKLTKKAIELADHFIHRKEYERKAKRRKTFWTVVLAVAGGILLILIFPYRLVVKRNGDFEIRSLLLRIYRNSKDYDIPAGGSSDFEIAQAADLEA